MSLIDTLRALAITVRNEKKKEANSAVRIGDLFLAIIDFIKSVQSGEIRQEGVDTYNDISEGKTSLLNGYPNPELNWTVLVRRDETSGGNASLYKWNGSRWINLETPIYTDDVISEISSKVDKSYSIIETLSFVNSDDRFFNYSKKIFEAGNNLIRSVTINTINIKQIWYRTEIINSSNDVAVLTFLDATNNLISYIQPFKGNAVIEEFINVPSSATQCVVAFRVGKSIETQIFSGTLIDNTTKLGYTNTLEVDFSISDNSFINRLTGIREAGNNKLRSVTKSLDNLDYVRYKSEIINSSNNLALLTFLDENDNIVLLQESFTRDALVSGVVGKPQGATKVVIAFRVGKYIEAQLLSGKIIDDTVRANQLNEKAKEITDISIQKEFSTITPVSFEETDDKFTNYFTGEVQSGNNLIRSVTENMTGISKVQYDTELVNSTNMAAAVIFFDEYHNIMSYHLPLKTAGAIKGEIDVPANAVTAEFSFRVGKHIFISLIASELQDTTIKKEFEVIKNVSFEIPDDFFIHYGNGNIVAGNNLVNSVTEEITENVKFIRYTADLIVSQSAFAVVTFLDENDKVIYYEQKWDSVKRANSITSIPPLAKKFVFAFRVGQYISVQLLGNTFVDDVVRQYDFKEVANKVNNSYQIARTLYDNPKTGESKVGNYRLECNTKKPEIYKRLSANNLSYTDVNKCKTQFDLINGSPKAIQDGLLNKMQGEVIDFTPSDNGFVRIVIGKDSQDRFYTAYLPSYRKGTRGDAKESKLEVTSDFISFNTIWKGSTGTDANGISIANHINLEPMQVRELANGSLLVGSGYTRSDQSNVDGNGNTGANAFVGYFMMSADHNSIALCNYRDLGGTTKPMNTTHHIMPGVNYYSNQPLYDWSIFIHGSVIVATEYGDRENSGIVWYSEDNGATFKQIFWMPNHYQDGVTNGDTVTYTHIHGVMYDHYRNRIYIIAGEANSNLFWSDKGVNTTDTDWHVENIRRQTRYPHLSYMQVVNGYPFRDCLIYGSDFVNMGAFMRVNRNKEGIAQQIEVAHEILPQIYSGTLYCAGGMTQRDQDSPVLMCMTRENAMGTPAQQTEHLKQHLSRVVATYDGFNFFEIWLDDTFGTYNMFNRKTGQMENREIAKCTRDMNAWLCNNGDLVIKYSGRDYIYMTSDYSEVLFGDFPSQIVRYKNVQKHL